MHEDPKQWYATTILVVRRPGHVVMIGDGQVSMGQTVMKHNAVKLRRMYHNKIIAGFAGATADAFSLFERFEVKLKDYSGNLTRASVELTKDWRMDRTLRRLEALLLVADKHHTFLLSGTGDVLEPDPVTHDCTAMAIGSGGNFALAAARALLAHSNLDPLTIGKAAMGIAADLCIYTNTNFHIEEITHDVATT